MAVIHTHPHTHTHNGHRDDDGGGGGEERDLYVAQSALCAMMIADGGANEQKSRSNDSGVEAKKRTKMKNIYHFALRRVVAPRSATNHGRQYTFSSENGFKC